MRRRSDPLESKPERVWTGGERWWCQGIWGAVSEAECVCMCVCVERVVIRGAVSEAERESVCVCVCVCVCVESGHPWVVC